MLVHGFASCDTLPAQVMLELKKELKKRRDSKGPVSEEEEISAWGRAGAFGLVPRGIKLMPAVMLVAVLSSAEICAFRLLQMQTWLTGDQRYKFGPHYQLKQSSTPKILFEIMPTAAEAQRDPGKVWR